MIITAGKFKGRKIIAPDEHITRPTLSKIRMSIFNTLYSLIGDFEGKTFLDLFGGSGIMGLEALSRGFDAVKVCEINKKSAEIIKKNYNSLNLKPDLSVCDSFKFLINTNQEFDVIYVDPPYESGIYETVLKNIQKGLIIVEYSGSQNFDEYKILKEKKYGGTNIIFIENC